jgi:DNA-binding NtrC family response regulator
MEQARILAVDDETMFLEPLVQRLKIRNYDARGVRTGEDALAYLEENPDTEVVLLDMKLPGMSGIQTLEAIKKRSPLTEVIILTGHASLEAGKKGLRLGAYDFLLKPVKLAEILEKIEGARARRNSRYQDGIYMK